MTEILDKASMTYPQLRLLYVENSRLSAEAISAVHSTWNSDPSERQETFCQLAQGMTAILEAYLSLFLARFRSRFMADRWGEICNTLLSELGQVVERTLV